LHRKALLAICTKKNQIETKINKTYNLKFQTATSKTKYKDTFLKNFLMPELEQLQPLLSCLGLPTNHLKQLQNKVSSINKQTQALDNDNAIKEV
jgi:hypothetical protein